MVVRKEFVFFSEANIYYLEWMTRDSDVAEAGAYGMVANTAQRS